MTEEETHRLRLRLLALEELVADQHDEMERLRLEARAIREQLEQQPPPPEPHPT